MSAYESFVIIPRSSIFNDILQLPRATNENPAVLENRVHYKGKKKERRHNNDNFVGVVKIDPDDVNEHAKVKVSYRSALSSLVEKKIDSKARRSFLNGEVPGKTQRKANATLKFAGSAWEEAEKRFLCIPKRLRKVSIGATKETTFRQLMIQVEALIDHFNATGTISCPSYYAEKLVGPFIAPPKVEDGNVLVLEIDLKKLPFKWLLLAMFIFRGQNYNFYDKRVEVMRKENAPEGVTLSDFILTALPSLPSTNTCSRENHRKGKEMNSISMGYVFV